MNKNRIMNLNNIYITILICLAINCNSIYAQSVGINATGTAPDASALLDVNASPNNNKGLLLPRLSTTERNAIVSPAQSLLIYNTTDSCYQGYIGTQWVSFGCVGSGSTPPPIGPTCGTQVFTAANLDVGTMINSTTGGQLQTNNGIVEKYCYNNIASNCATMGGLYEWDEAMNYATSINCDPCGNSGTQGICPANFHLPTDLEWSRYEFCIENTLATTGTTSLAIFQTTLNGRGSTLAGVGPGSKMKATSSNIPAWDGTNTSGFNAIPSGCRNGTSGAFCTLLSPTYFWTATEFSVINAWYRSLATGNNQSTRNNFLKQIGISIRCIQN